MALTSLRREHITNRAFLRTHAVIRVETRSVTPSRTLRTLSRIQSGHAILSYDFMNDSQVRAVELLAQEYGYGWGSLHAHKVADLATSIFDRLELLGLLPGLTLDDRQTLVALGYSHDIGASPRARQETSLLPNWAKAFAETDRHGVMAFHAIRARIDTASSERPISTLNPEERSLLLYCLLWHASSAEYVLDTEPLLDRRKALLLAGILRVADGLDGQHRLRVREIEIHKASAWLRLLVRSLEPATEEVAQTQKKSDMLSHALSLRIFVQEVVGA